ncbi:cysteine desulfurase CsdA [Pectobacterium carotovorum]|uniref:cysteine desulfurase CsdA n=1 Tax=Pectobacterium carotovorum TaxID=554 RepID=UPI00050109FC|nr:cysteine desulfurase CsdA [Pectobacterium carotovorum]KAA3666702.1 cysteine desulfurase CsdA [Pectobacterium carotovorum subsp. carotovorum]KFX00182.1 cysteine sulfinate desulfinase [Pectobacterium carotovorum subsp. carotovorum]KML71220.1 cysteine sulfinate desulfinase [Pectobacterium carotovorum subsp. carotovorum ICMP 5702]MBA0194081.1 cysteine desulfurase CsdA [Pectobacterium carotovorum]MBA0200826.1 cysteine desulfurase CsdA [Pectobacterium carotovorum]
MTPFNPATFRQQFPALQHSAVYLDSAATALKPQPVIDAVQAFYGSESGTVHRSQHRGAQALTQRFEGAREQVATLLHADDPRSIVWTRGTTEAINLVAQSYARPRLQPGDEIVVSEAEHHANLIPWLMVAQQTGANIVKLPIGADLLPDIEQLATLITPKTRLLALGQMSNVTGGQPDLARAITLAHRYGAVVMVDGAQGIVHCPPDVQALDIDFYAFSGHKLYAPTGIGVLYGKTALLESMMPWQGGGKMMTQVSFDGFKPQAIPQRFEAGTPHIAGVLGLSAALDWLTTLDWHAAEQHSQQLAQLAETYLAQFPGFRSFRSPQSSVLSFDIADVHHSDLVTLLAESGIALRAGHHCAQPLMDALGVSGTLRASFAPYNNQQDVAALIAAVGSALELLID